MVCIIKTKFVEQLSISNTIAKTVSFVISRFKFIWGEIVNMLTPEFLRETPTEDNELLQRLDE
jgi:hypothetical protein